MLVRPQFIIIKEESNFFLGFRYFTNHGKITFFVLQLYFFYLVGFENQNKKNRMKIRWEITKRGFSTWGTLRRKNLSLRRITSNGRPKTKDQVKTVKNFLNGCQSIGISRDEILNMDETAIYLDSPSKNW